MKVWIFLRVLYLYRKKVVWIGSLDWGERLVEVLIFVGVDDIGCDIGVFGVKVSEILDFAGFSRIF